MKYCPKPFKIRSGIFRKINRKFALHLIANHSIFYERKSIDENENITCFETVWARVKSVISADVWFSRLIHDDNFSVFMYKQRVSLKFFFFKVYTRAMWNGTQKRSIRVLLSSQTNEDVKKILYYLHRFSGKDTENAKHFPNQRRILSQRGWILFDFPIYHGRYRLRKFALLLHCSRCRWSDVGCLSLLFLRSRHWSGFSWYPNTRDLLLWPFLNLWTFNTLFTLQNKTWNSLKSRGTL